MSKQVPNPYYLRESQVRNQVHRQPYPTRQSGPRNAPPRASQVPPTMATSPGQAFTGPYPYPQYGPQPSYPVMLQHASPMPVNGGAMRMPQYSPYMHQAYTSSYGQGPQTQQPQYYMTGQMPQPAGMRPPPMTTMSMPGSGYAQQPPSAAPQSYYMPIVTTQAQQPQPPKRERKISPILDPNTGRDVLADNGAVRSSVESGGVRSQNIPITAIDKPPGGLSAPISSSLSADADADEYKPMGTMNGAAYIPSESTGYSITVDPQQMVDSQQIDCGATFEYDTNRDELPVTSYTQDTTFKMDDVYDSGVQVQGDSLVAHHGSDVLAQALDVTSVQPQGAARTSSQLLVTRPSAAGINVMPVLSQTLSSQLSQSAAASAVGSAASERDQSTVKAKQQPEPAVCEPLNYKASKEPEAPTKDATSKAGVPSRGSASDPAAARPSKSMEAPKYCYREDQWSPINPEGKKLYDRKFLLTLQYAKQSLERPEGLPQLSDIILDKPFGTAVVPDPGRRAVGKPISGADYDFTPGYVKAHGSAPRILLSQLSQSIAVVSAVGSAASELAQSTVMAQQQSEPAVCEPLNNKASKEPAALTKDATNKIGVPSRGSATGPAAVSQSSMEAAKYCYRKSELVSQDRPTEVIAQRATSTDPLLACCLCGRLLQDAVQLTCLHNCCKCCFSAAASANNSAYVACSSCGYTTCSGDQQPNGFIEQEVQRYMAIAESRSCGVCRDNDEPDIPALMWCSACKHSLCGDCQALHRQYKRSHVTQSLEELKSLDEVCPQSSATACPIHKRLWEIVCLNCNLAKCTSCWVECKKSKHEMHIAGDDSFDNYVGQVITFISSEESALLRMTRLLDNPKHLLNDLKTARALHLDQIAQRKRRIVDAVEVAYQRIECRTKNVYDDLEKEAGDASEVAERIGLNLSDARNYIQRLLDANSKFEILNQQGIIRERLKALSAEIDALKNTTAAIRAVDIDSSLPDDFETLVEAWIGVLHTDSGHGPLGGLNDQGNASGGRQRSDNWSSYDKGLRGDKDWNTVEPRKTIPNAPKIDGHT